MMPFMAGQSMLMGDAFGKAYQYGKRKISAMTNEEFNKLTPEQLGKEIQTDYSAMIPSLSVAIKQSSNFQSLIIQELATIIRSIPKDIISGFTQGTSGEANPIQTISTQVQQPSANIDYGQIALATIKLMLGPIAGSFSIPNAPSASAEISSSDTSSQTVDEYAHTLGTHSGHTVGNIEQGPTEGPTERKDLPQNQPSQKVLSASEDPVYLEWITKLGKLKGEFNSAQARYNEAKAKASNIASPHNTSTMTSNYNKIFDIQVKIKQMSNDYRHPNNHIRENALRLRQNIANGQWRRKA